MSTVWCLVSLLHHIRRAQECEDLFNAAFSFNYYCYYYEITLSISLPPTSNFENYKAELQICKYIIIINTVQNGLI